MPGGCNLRKALPVFKDADFGPAFLAGLATRAALWAAPFPAWHRTHCRQIEDR
jgi:hypothetical protein